jgi:hypothetical protein
MAQKAPEKKIPWTVLVSRMRRRSRKVHEIVLHQRRGGPVSFASVVVVVVVVAAVWLCIVIVPGF